MLFNSYEFIFLFLPLSCIVFFVIASRAGTFPALIWLSACSVYFYSSWRLENLWLLVFSICVNYALALYVSGARQSRFVSRYVIFVFAIAVNLLILGYYKYSGFVASSIGVVFDIPVSIDSPLLPLAISFYTFTQIAYQVDSYRQGNVDRSFINYFLFVTYYPHLIAGPIVHHSELMPQFTFKSVYRPHLANICVGLSLFILGLFKKVCIADTLAPFSDAVFAAATGGATISFFEAWGGALSYTFQIYFDFSGYSDMAMGSAALLGIWLPINFFSPYRALSIVEFWRRWHITLSRFLRDYLYISLGGNRQGPSRRYVNLMLTMILGGLWHGAGWTFVVWGALHGAFLVANHAWHALVSGLRLALPIPKYLSATLSWLITFLAVVVAWVFFRAESFAAALAMLEGMAGLHGAVLDERLGRYLQFLDLFVEFGGRGIGSFGSAWGLVAIAVSLAISLFPYTSWQFVGYRWHALESHSLAVPELTVDAPMLRSRMLGVCWGLFIGILFILSVSRLTRVNQFVYFNF